MLSVNLLALALATTVSAVPFKGLNSTRWTPEHILKSDEVILYGEGRSKYIFLSTLVSHSVLLPTLRARHTDQLHNSGGCPQECLSRAHPIQAYL